MDNGIHFISGQPRSSSTLLAALLRQNPAPHANISSAVSGLVASMLRGVSQGNEAAVLEMLAWRAGETFHHSGILWKICRFLVPVRLPGGLAPNLWAGDE